MKKQSNIVLSEDKHYENLGANDQTFLQKAMEQGMTRREAITWMVAAGFTATTAGSIFTSAQEVMAATPKRGGTVKYASDIHGPSDTLDPILLTSIIDYARARINYNSLTQFRHGIEPVGDLAEEFSSNNALTEWTFKLYKNVRFHDGSQLTVDDVIWSLNRHTAKDSKSKAKALVTGVKEWKKIDNHTLKAILDAPNIDLPAILGTYHFKIVKKGTTNFQKPVGTGPYELIEFNPGVGSKHIRFPDYFRDGGYFDEIEMFAITDPVARVNSLLSGDVQMIANLSPKAIRQVEATPGVGVTSEPTGGYLAICCLLNTAPGNNPDFVQMMKNLPPREKILKSILKGYGTLGNDQPINVSYGADFCSALPQRKLDPDKAKFHMKKSGISQAELFVAETASGMVDSCLTIQREAQKIGFNLKINKVPTDGYWGAVWMKEPLNTVSWTMRPTANIMLSIAFAPDAPWNDTYWKNERFGKLLVESRSVKDPKKRHEMYCEMETLIHNESGSVIFAHRNNVDGKSNKIKGIPKVPLGPLGGGEWPEFAWLDS